MMGTRIMAGELRGMHIGPLPKDILARPILARIKKSVFDIIKNRLPDAKFLDLFSGSGTVGFEALSRGASKVVMIDANPKSARWLQQTYFAMGRKNPWVARQRLDVHCANVMSGLAWLNDRFDIIFSGAPYVDKDKKALFFIDDLLASIPRDNVLSDKGWFVAQHHQRETFTAPANWDFFRQEKYGDTRVSFFRYAAPKTEAPQP